MPTVNSMTYSRPINDISRHLSIVFWISATGFTSSSKPGGTGSPGAIFICTDSYTNAQFQLTISVTCEIKSCRQPNCIEHLPALRLPSPPGICRRKISASILSDTNFIWCLRPAVWVYRVRSPTKSATPQMWQLYTMLLLAPRFGLRENTNPNVPSDNCMVVESTWRSTFCSTCRCYGKHGKQLITDLPSNLRECIGMKHCTTFLCE